MTLSDTPSADSCEAKPKRDQSERLALDALAAEYGFHVRHTEERSFYSISEYWPLWITAEYSAEGECVLYGVVRCRGQIGCRTDLNDWVSALWAINLRMWQICSPFLIDEEGFCDAAERAARYIIFAQSDVDTFRAGKNDGDVVMLFMTTRRACELISELWGTAGVDTVDTFYVDANDLPPSFRKAFGPEQKMDICGIRSGVIAYYRRYVEDTSFTDMSRCSAWSKVRWMVGGLGATIGESLNARLVLTGTVRNVIPRKDQNRIDTLLQKLEPGASDRVIFPCESHLLCVTEKGILARRVDSGADRYAEEYIELKKLSSTNNAFLGQDASFVWSSDVDPARFEELVHALLHADPLVRRVKQVGHSNEPDGGRDCIAEVNSRFMKRGTDEAAPEQTVHIIVQCKVSTRNVGKGSVVDIRDTVDRHNAQGFLLVAFPGTTRSLVDYVESIRFRKLFWIEAWTKADVEARLRENLSCARRFSDVVTVDDGDPLNHRAI